LGDRVDERPQRLALQEMLDHGVDDVTVDRPADETLDFVALEGGHDERFQDVAQPARSDPVGDLAAEL
jgi:hypothetical protein